MKRPVEFDGCLGWFHDAPGTRGVVLCAALGLEDLCARQSWCLLADELAAAGLPTLRFDYHGTGDSAGNVGGSGQAERWIGNIDRAATWLEEHAHITELVFVGLRFGATLAAAAARKRSDVTRLVLLAPAPSGRTYARELQLASKIVVPMGGAEDASKPATGDTLDVAGYVAGKDLLEDLKSLDLMQLASSPAREIMVACTPGSSVETKLLTHLEAIGATVTRRDFADYAAMMISPTNSAPCLETIASVVAWLGQDVPHRTVRNSMPDLCADLAGPHWVEQPQLFGPEKSLVGIFCQPVHAADDRPCVVILNSGRDSHIGWARSAVDLARELAGSGIASLRFDLSYIGDSQPDRKGRRAELYSAASLPDVRAAIDHLEELDYRNVTLLAGCSGAYLAFHAALADARVKNVVLRNIQRFVWRFDDRIMFPVNERLGMSRLGAARSTGSSFRRLVKTLRLGGICYRIAKSILTLTARGVSRLTLDGPRLKRAIARFSQSGRRMLLVYGSTNEGRSYLNELFGHDGRDLTQLSGIDIQFIDGADHNFTCARSREKLAGFVQSLVLGK